MKSEIGIPILLSAVITFGNEYIDYTMGELSLFASNLGSNAIKSYLNDKKLLVANRLDVGKPTVRKMDSGLMISLELFDEHIHIHIGEDKTQCHMIEDVSIPILFNYPVTLNLKSEAFMENMYSDSLEQWIIRDNNSSELMFTLDEIKSLDNGVGVLASNVVLNDNHYYVILSTNLSENKELEFELLEIGKKAYDLLEVAK